MITTLTGSNSYKLQSELNRLKTKFIKEYNDLGYEKIDGEEAGADRMNEAIQSLPFLANKKLVVLRNPSAQKPFIDNFEQVIKDIPKTTDLVIVEPKLDKRSSYFKMLKNQTDYREYNNLDSHELSKWIVQYVRNNGGSINQADATYLIERVGHDQQLLANELDKLLVYNTQISHNTINLLTDESPQSTIFELLDAAFAGNVKKVNKIYKEQKALKVEPQQIIAMLAWQLHVLAIIKTAGDKNTDVIAKEAKLNPFVVRKTVTLASKISLSDTKKLVKRAVSLDKKIKTKNINADDALIDFLMTLTS